MNFLFKLVKNHNMAKGDIQNDLAKCLYCGKCERCRPKAITVNRKEKEWQWDSDKCVRCGHCVAACPAKSLKLAK
jgi:formate hydrogenlyase subunit 6/NADH:ubiquinone oxidoreductase subunit I